jgi:hypothetical protein
VSASGTCSISATKAGDATYNSATTTTPATIAPPRSRSRRRRHRGQQGLRRDTTAEITGARCREQHPAGRRADLKLTAAFADATRATTRRHTSRRPRRRGRQGGELQPGDGHGRDGQHRE